MPGRSWPVYLNSELMRRLPKPEPEAARRGCFFFAAFSPSMRGDVRIEGGRETGDERPAAHKFAPEVKGREGWKAYIMDEIGNASIERAARQGQEGARVKRLRCCV